MDITNEAEKAPKRYAGILVHPTSFPSPYGIGDLGKGAYAFVDFLERSGMTAWQVLPLGHTGFGDSPYQPFSSFAGQPYIISPDHLKELHLLYDSDMQGMPVWNPENIDYGDAIAFKTNLLHTAYERFCDPEVHDGFSSDAELMQQYEVFCNGKEWLDDYALFMAGKDFHEGAPWYLWEDNLKNPTRAERKEWEEKLAKEIGYYKFIQFLFYYEWMKLKRYANEKGISIIGDIPIFVSGSIRNCSVWIPRDIPPSLQVCRRIISRPPDSCGEIRSTTGKSTPKPATNGGSTGSVTS